MERCVQENCRRYATIYHPAPYFDAHWAVKYSTQHIEGKDIPFLKLFRDNLEKRGLWKKPDEDRQQWNERCEKAAKKSKLLGGS